MKTNEFIREVNHLGFSVKDKKYTGANEIWLIVCEGEHTKIVSIEKNTRFLIDTNYANFIHLDDDLKEELFDLAIEYAKTPVEEREEEKRFIIPLPGLVTTDGKQQYLSQDYNFFASRRDRTLKQTWKEEDLKFVPEIYRQFAMEFEKGKENK